MRSMDFLTVVTGYVAYIYWSNTGRIGGSVLKRVILTVGLFTTLLTGCKSEDVISHLQLDVEEAMKVEGLID